MTSIVSAIISGAVGYFGMKAYGPISMVLTLPVAVLIGFGVAAVGDLIRGR